MKKVVLISVAFCAGFLLGAASTGGGSPPVRDHELRITYPVRPVTHPGTGETTTVFRTVLLIPRDGTDPAWTVERDGVVWKYAELPD